MQQTAPLLKSSLENNMKVEMQISSACIFTWRSVQCLFQMVSTDLIVKNEQFKNQWLI